MARGTITEPQPLTLAELLDRFGPMPAWRIRNAPPPGTAREDDWLALGAAGEALCELVDGVLVEKDAGYFEARLAAVLVHILEAFLEQHDLGIVVGPDAGSRFLPRLIRIPDVSFVSWKRLPNRQVPRDALPDLVPDLAVEVLSASNTRREMERKLHDYFEAGVLRVWYADPRTRTVRVYTAVDQMTEIGPTGVLDGGDVLPGFTLPVAEWFARAERPQPPSP